MLEEMNMVTPDLINQFEFYYERPTRISRGHTETRDLDCSAAHGQNCSRAIDRRRCGHGDRYSSKNHLGKFGLLLNQIQVLKDWMKVNPGNR